MEVSESNQESEQSCICLLGYGSACIKARNVSGHVFVC